MIVSIKGTPDPSVHERTGTALSWRLSRLALAAQLALGAIAGALSARAADAAADAGDKKVAATNTITQSVTNAVANTNNNAAAARREPKDKTKDPGTGGKPVKLDYPSFRNVSDRNIFNADRTRRTSRGGGEPGARPRPAPISTITFVGFLGSPQGDRAFFDGTGGTYRKALKSGESLGDFKIGSITSKNAVLELGSRRFSLKIGEQLRKEEAGSWELSNSGNRSSSISAESGTSAAEGAGAGASKDGDSTESAGADDVLQRLLKKRQLEENK